MKLNKTQIEVLAAEIYNELEVEANKYKESEEYKNFEDTLKNDDTYKAWKKVEKAVNDNKEFLDLDGYHIRRLLEGFATYVTNQRSKTFKTASIPTKQAIINKIILKTIDTDSVEDIIASVKESLKK